MVGQISMPINNKLLLVTRLSFVPAELAECISLQIVDNSQYPRHTGAVRGLLGRPTSQHRPGPATAFTNNLLNTRHRLAAVMAPLKFFNKVCCVTLDHPR